MNNINKVINSTYIRCNYSNYYFIDNVRIVCDVNWAKKGQVMWDETIKKILEQASVEITYNKQLRDKLEEEREKGKFILSLI